jgi:hypothetical protein
VACRETVRHRIGLQFFPAILNAVRHRLIFVVSPLAFDWAIFQLELLSFVLPVQAILTPVIRVFMCVSAETRFANAHR